MEFDLDLGLGLGLGLDLNFDLDLDSDLHSNLALDFDLDLDLRFRIWSLDFLRISSRTHLGTFSAALCASLFGNVLRHVGHSCSAKLSASASGRVGPWAVPCFLWVLVKLRFATRRL